MMKKRAFTVGLPLLRSADRLELMERIVSKDMMKKRTITDGLPLLRSADRLEMMDGIAYQRFAR